MIAGIVASQIAAPPMGTVWTTIGTATPNSTVAFSWAGGGGGCPTASTTNTWLTSSYPPGNYVAGYIMRVATYTDEATFCQYFYFRAD